MADIGSDMVGVLHSESAKQGGGIRKFVLTYVCFTLLV